MVIPPISACECCIEWEQRQAARTPAAAGTARHFDRASAEQPFAFIITANGTVLPQNHGTTMKNKFQKSTVCNNLEKSVLFNGKHRLYVTHYQLGLMWTPRVLLHLHRPP